MILTGIEELLGKTPEPAYRTEMDLKQYIDEIKGMIKLQDFKSRLMA